MRVGPGLMAAVIVMQAGCVRRAPVLPSPVGVEEWEVPWADAFPSDVVVDSAGVVWFTDRVAHVIGRFDPVTEKFEAYRPATPASAPYGLIVAPDGGLWYAASRAGRLGRVDPATGRIEEHVLTGATGGPQQLAWSREAIWFSLRESNSYGRYDVRTGSTHVYAVERFRPYSVEATPDGHIWFDTYDSWFLIEVDPTTGQPRVHDLGEPPPPGMPFASLVETDSAGRRRFRTIRDSAEYAALPDSVRSRVSINRLRGRAKRMASDRRGGLWLSDFQAGRVVRFDPRERTHVEYRSLTRGAAPYGITVAASGQVWFAESGNQAIVVLDPSSGARTSVRIPTSGGTVRHLFVDERRGNVWLPLSDIGRLARIRLR